MSKAITLLLVGASSLAYFISILLNCLGVYLLASTKPITNNNTILISLATSEITVAVIKTIYNFMRGFSGEHQILLMNKFMALVWLLYYFAMCVLPIDRLIGIMFPLKYRVMVTRRRLLWAILAEWFVTLLLSISFFFSDSWFNFFWTQMWVPLDVTCVCLCMVAYGLIFNRILARKRMGNSQQAINVTRRQRFLANRNRKFIKIVAFIILSFIFLILIPDIIFQLYPAGNQVVFESVNIIWPIGLVVDPVIYVFLQDDLRLLLKRKLFKVRVEENAAHQETAF